MSLLALLRYLPYLIELVNALKNRIDQDKLDRKVSEDIQAITEALNEKDVNKLNHIFDV